jgi:hypothetical protein
MHEILVIKPSTKTDKLRDLSTDEWIILNGT